MKRPLMTLAFFGSLALVAVTGCAHNTYVAAPPPPPVNAPPLVQLAERDGFKTGRADGERDSINGIRFKPEATRAYHDTPGYDPRLGPFPVYRDAFRNAYIRGYNIGYRRG